MTTKLDLILDQLKVLTLLEARDLVQKIEKEFGVSVAQQIEAFPSSVSAAEVTIALEEEQSSFDLYLVEVPADRKIPVLKIVRSATGFGLKECKEIVENLPKVIKESMSKEDATALKTEFESAGAKIEVK